MDWNNFFEQTRVAAGVESFSKLAPLLGISDGAIGHYRNGRRVPQVWIVAEALKIQGHPAPDKAAIAIMKAAALTSPERTFWKRLSTAAVMIMLVGGTLPESRAGIDSQRAGSETISRNSGVCLLCQFLKWTLARFLRMLAGPSIGRRKRHDHLLALQG